MQNCIYLIILTSATKYYAKYKIILYTHNRQCMKNFHLIRQILIYVYICIVCMYNFFLSFLKQFYIPTEKN